MSLETGSHSHTGANGKGRTMERGVMVGGVLIAVSLLIAMFLNHSVREPVAPAGDALAEAVAPQASMLRRDASPFPIDADRAIAGKAVFARECARCHEGDRTGPRDDHTQLVLLDGIRLRAPYLHAGSVAKVSEQAKSKSGHLFGSGLSAVEKDDLLEYLKTL
jgi:mono/diheme cytochrome c family protein